MDVTVPVSGSMEEIPLDLIPEKLDPHRFVFEVSRKDLNDVAADPEFPPLEGDVIALVKHAHKNGEGTPRAPSQVPR